MARTRAYSFRFGGQNFGFNVPTEVGEGEREETQSVLADYFPELKFTIPAKGARGQRLGRESPIAGMEITMKPGQASTGTPSTPAPTPETPAPTTPTPAAPTPPAQQAPQEPARKPFTWSSNLGGAGFGTEDYQQALREGYTKEEIGEYINKSSAAFGGGRLNVGADVRSALGLGSSYQSDLAKIATGQAASVQATPQNYQAKTQATGGFGAGALEAARASGKSDAQIKQYIQAHGLKVGPAAKAALGL